MEIFDELNEKWKGSKTPFLVHAGKEYFFNDIIESDHVDLSSIKFGDVVALIGDFDPQTISIFLKLVQQMAIVVPLTKETKSQHEYFFEVVSVDVIIEDGLIKKRTKSRKHPLIQDLNKKQKPGLVLFSTGTTGRPKAILHNFENFIERFRTPRQAYTTLNFLMFDHIGGINTLFHTLFNKGLVVTTKSRQVSEILEILKLSQIEVLPTTPTFLRLMLLSGLIPDQLSKSLRIISYGTERMDQTTLDQLCALLPDVDFRQTYGMSEIGIVRVKSKARNSLFMRLGGEGIKTRIKEGVLEIWSRTKMLGYLNANSPFDQDGWYNTGDLVLEEDGYYKVIGRTSEIINVGGLKFLASELERVALEFHTIEFAKAKGITNPITGQHAELVVQTKSGAETSKNELLEFLKSNLPGHMVPSRIIFDEIKITHRLKRD